MTADWAKIKAYRAHWPEGGWSEEKIVADWAGLTPGVHELARMYDKYEPDRLKPAVDVAAEAYAAIACDPYETGIAVHAFKAGAAWQKGQANTY